MILWTEIQPIRLETRGPDGVIPSREQAEDGIPGYACAGDEFQEGGRAAEPLGHGGNGLYELLLVEHGC